MIISISGTHCTGKSTLIEAMKKHPAFKDAVFLKSSGRALAKENSRIKVNEDGDFFTQFYQMSKDCHQLLEAMDNPLVICDRCYIDTHVYSCYLYDKGKLSLRQLETLNGMVLAMNSMVKFDKVFLLKPSFELQNEENRSMNKDFQKEIFDKFDCYALRDTRFEYLPDSLEFRINKLVSYVQGK